MQKAKASLFDILITPMDIIVINQITGYNDNFSFFFSFYYSLFILFYTPHNCAQVLFTVSHRSAST